MAHPIELLDRQFERLKELDGAEWMRELRRFYDFITSGPLAVTMALDELRADANARQAEFEAYDADMAGRLVKLRDELVARAPEVDDSGQPRPPGRDLAFMEWQFGLSNFDELAAAGGDRMIVQEGSDHSRSGMMLRILEQKFRRFQWSEIGPNGSLVPSDRDQRPDLDDLAREFRNLSDEHRHAAQDFAQFTQTGGFQIVFLDMVVEEMNPPARKITTDEELHEHVGELLKRVGAGFQYVEDAAAGRSVNQRGQETLEIHVRRLRPAVEAVYEDLRTKLATAPVVEPGYWQRLQGWVRSPGYALLGGPCIAGAVTGGVTGQHAGLGVFVVLAVLLAIVPPMLPGLRKTMFSRLAWVLVGVAVAAVIVGVLFDWVIGVAVFFALSLAAMVGQHALGRPHSDSDGAPA